jgi:hypothetical protein
LQSCSAPNSRFLLDAVDLLLLMIDFFFDFGLVEAIDDGIFPFIDVNFCESYEYMITIKNLGLTSFYL